MMLNATVRSAGARGGECTNVGSNSCNLLGLGVVQELGVEFH